MRLTILLSLLLALCAPMGTARAQSSTAESLVEATRLYDDLQVERALVLLRQVISPGSPFEVSREQRVKAYTYIGASLAILGMRDSSVAYFRAALERDPFVDLDPARFTQQERGAFAEARKRTLAVGARPIPARVFDPRAETMPLVIVTTHPAMTRVWIELPNDTASIVLLDRESEGVREMFWNGLLPDGRVAPAGRYALGVRGVTRVATDSARIPFELSHQHPPLEPMVPELVGAQLLAERYSQSMSFAELAKGLGIATVALALPSLGSRRLSGTGRPLVNGIAVAAIAAGTAGFVHRRLHPENSAAIEENRRRRAAVAARNADIERRNAERLAGLRIVITSAGLAP